jgi:hypothetical protein
MFEDLNRDAGKFTTKKGYTVAYLMGKGEYWARIYHVVSEEGHEETIAQGYWPTDDLKDLIRLANTY